MARKKLKHIEVEGAIVNIRQGLYDFKGRKVTSIEIIPDRPDNWKVVPKVHNVKVIQLKGRKKLKKIA